MNSILCGNQTPNGWFVGPCTFMELVQHIMKEGKNPELFATIAWTIWYCRNMIRTSHKELPVAQVLVHASQVLQDFLQVLPASSRQNVAHNPRLVRWLPPPNSRFKVNFDGTVFRYQQRWDRSGYSQPWWPSFGLHVWNYPPPSFNRCLEALAAVRAITFTFELGFSNIVVEGDSKQLSKNSQVRRNLLLLLVI